MFTIVPRIRRVSEIDSITIDRERLASSGYVFVAATLPPGTSKVFVERGECMCTSRPAWTIAGSAGWSLFAVPADMRGRPDEQAFQIMMRGDDVRPYAGPYWVGDLREATCAELAIDCDRAGVKRRAVRP